MRRTASRFCGARGFGRLAWPASSLAVFACSCSFCRRCDGGHSTGQLPHPCFRAEYAFEQGRRPDRNIDARKKDRTPSTPYAHVGKVCLGNTVDQLKFLNDSNGNAEDHAVLILDFQLAACAAIAHPRGERAIISIRLFCSIELCLANVDHEFFPTRRKASEGRPLSFVQVCGLASTVAHASLAIQAVRLGNSARIRNCHQILRYGHAPDGDLACG